MESGQAPDARPDFDEIRKNAMSDGIPLCEIAIIYRDLSDEEVWVMEAAGLVALRTETGIIGRFAKDGTVMFQEKSVGVLHLAS
jgi:hypothetical protein